MYALLCNIVYDIYFIYKYMCEDLYLGLVAYTYIWEVEISGSQFHNHREFPDTKQNRAVEADTRVKGTPEAKVFCHTSRTQEHCQLPIL